MNRTIERDPVRLATLLRILDLLALVLAAQVATLLRFGTAAAEFPPIYTVLQYVAVGLGYALLPRFGLYSAWSTQTPGRMVLQLCSAWACTLGILVLFGVLTRLAGDLSRLWLLYWFGAGAALLALVRAATRWSLPLAHRYGWHGAQVLLIGGGPLGRQLLRQARTEGRLDYTVRAWCPAPGGADAPAPGGVDALTHADQLPAYLERNTIDEIWIALPMSEVGAISQLQHLLRHHCVEIRWIMDTGPLQILRANMETFFGYPALNLNCPGTGYANRLGKLVFDKVFALLVMTLLSPLYLAIWIGVKRSSPGPACFIQRRVGLNGATFNVFKFRTMWLHDTPGQQLVQATQNDSRVTPFGAFLRRTSLDELPQFLNVLLGDMSVVGPRPHAVQHTAMYSDLLDTYMVRHRAKPGITGWAQINGHRGETDTLDKMEKRVQYDVYYIRHGTLLLDLRIVLWTALRGWRDTNAY